MQRGRSHERRDRSRDRGRNYDKPRDRSRDRRDRSGERRDRDRSGDRSRANDRSRDDRPRDNDRPRDGDRPRDSRSGDRPRDHDRPRDDRAGDRPRENDRPRESERPRDMGNHSKYGSSRDDNGYEEDDYQPPQESTGPWDSKAEAEKDPNWARIYVTNLPAGTTVDELQGIFGGLGVIAKEKQKRGYKDQWPWKIKIYTNDDGTQKGDAVITYEDSNAARSAPGFFNGSDIRGNTITVELAGKPEPPVGGWMGGPGGGRGGGRGGGGGGRYGGGGGGGSRYRPY
ncbi:hypothetical protein SDRG_09257 [Saprolegnia diclina VS20]|uniref:RRM domain-containing protein n=1 Tax=Saprolegnia diclina (strain VS20) TaxID=1156394 RepID=T0QHU1_SAPDV|nr:hypothetical protein SDRG_09257 [Saprolegnia diclina VS20]EQC33275.1 hypothetical protein SDRG_09257 [Saprolegnia diclina VS20]|eukprot:XP_008613398.1 hypothetical protein SDRG_09257 [Saprolegnia diclina VS20]